MTAETVSQDSQGSFFTRLTALEKDFASWSTRALLAERALLGVEKSTKYQDFLGKLQARKTVLERDGQQPTERDMEYLETLERAISAAQTEAESFNYKALWVVPMYAALPAALWVLSPKVAVIPSIVMAAALALVGLGVALWHRFSQGFDNYYLKQQDLANPKTLSEQDYAFRKQNLAGSLSTYSGRFFLGFARVSSKDLNAMHWKLQQINAENDPNQENLERLEVVVNDAKGTTAVKSIAMIIPLALAGVLAAFPPEMAGIISGSVTAAILTLVIYYGRGVSDSSKYWQEQFSAEHDAALGQERSAALATVNRPSYSIN